MNQPKDVLFERFIKGHCAICDRKFEKDTPQRVELLDGEVLTVCDRHHKI